MKVLTFPVLACVAAAATFSTVAFRKPPDQIGSADRLAWETLAKISQPVQPGDAPKLETPFSWRLWWTSIDVYADKSSNSAQQPVSTAARFRPLPCQQQSEKLTAFAGQPQPDKACEVVWLNGASAGYVLSNRLWQREKLSTAAAAHQVSFPQSPNPGHVDPQAVAVELKTEWEPLSQGQSSRFIAAIDQEKTPRGLVAFHMMIRSRPNWLWATFIHEDCAHLVTDAGATFNDSFGSRNSQPSDALRRLLQAHHAELLVHYKLIGTQTDFSTVLGNPLIEPAALIKQKKISCISCHSFASVDSLGHVPHQTPQAGVPQVPSIFNSVNFNFTLTEHSKCRFMANCST